MRYQNWDVLLFAGSSAVPLQEFDTKCHGILKDDSQYHANSNASFTNYESMSHALFLTSFVPSQAPYTPFRLSIHTWHRPCASSILSLRKTQDEIVAFEASVFIDGILRSRRLLHERTEWPVVIGAGDMGRALQFPAFHAELLTQDHWSPTASHGRVQVVLAEGVTKTDSPLVDRLGAFDRLRNIVTFSFQHAPQNVLEQSGIAWPNPHLFNRIPKRSRRHEPIGTRLPMINNADLHAHSPTKANSAMPRRVFPTAVPLANRQPFPTSAAASSSAATSAFAGFPLPNITDDPFMESANFVGSQWRSRTRTSSGHDVSMRDGSSYKSDFSHGTMAMSELSCQQPDFAQQLNQAAANEIIQALSPGKQAEVLEALSPPKKANGLRPPSNTPIGTEVKILRGCPNTQIRTSAEATTNSRSGHTVSEEQKSPANRRATAPPTVLAEKQAPSRTSKLGTLSKALGLSSLTSGSVRLSASPAKGAVFAHIDRGMDTSSPASRLSLSEFIRSRSDSNASKRKRSSSLETHSKTSRQGTPYGSPSDASRKPSGLVLESENPNPSADSVALIL